MAPSFFVATSPHTCILVRSKSRGAHTTDAMAPEPTPATSEETKVAVLVLVVVVVVLADCCCCSSGFVGDIVVAADGKYEFVLGVAIPVALVAAAVGIVMFAIIIVGNMNRKNHGIVFCIQQV